MNRLCGPAFKISYVFITFTPVLKKGLCSCFDIGFVRIRISFQFCPPSFNPFTRSSTLFFSIYRCSCFFRYLIFFFINKIRKVTFCAFEIFSPMIALSSLFLPCQTSFIALLLFSCCRYLLINRSFNGLLSTFK